MIPHYIRMRTHFTIGYEKQGYFFVYPEPIFFRIPIFIDVIFHAPRDALRFNE